MHSQGQGRSIDGLWKLDEGSGLLCISVANLESFGLFMNNDFFMAEVLQAKGHDLFQGLKGS